MSLQHSDTILIKLGGSILHQEETIDALCRDIQRLRENNQKILLVHGGSKAINEALKQYHIEAEFIDGLRVTSNKAIKIIEMVLCGQVNQILVRGLNHHQVPAIGLSGAENRMLFCKPHSEVHGFVGDIETVHPGMILHLLSCEPALMPVIASIGVNEAGQAMNINADLAAAHLAASLNVKQLIYLTDQDGIYDQERRLFSMLSISQLIELINEGIVTGGMLVKVRAILHALHQGLDEVLILNGQKEDVLSKVILNQERQGSLCTSN
jgi:acetylglutamate kinase